MKKVFNMLKNKRGYWQGKKRDEKTLKRLSESKYKSFVQYDINGNLIKIWKSGKEIGTQIFKDYKIVNGGSRTKIYKICENKLIVNRLKYNSYWFKSEELIDKFNEIPEKINVEFNKRKSRSKPTKINRYSVECYDMKSGELITTYLNTDEAATKLNITRGHINKLCTGKRKLKDLVLKYGEKSLQSIKIL
jgi:hypothetical protein